VILPGTRLPEARRRAAERLAAEGIDDAMLEARLILRMATGIDPALPGRGADGCLDADQAARLGDLLARRLAREPIARLAGHGAFHGLDLTLNAACLIPRGDTEAVVEAALALLPRDAPSRVLDLGVGPGTILLALLSERPAATGLGIDLSGEALAAARANATALGLAGRAAFQTGRWSEGLGGAFDLVVSNPPYIPSADCDGLAPEVARHDPRLALDGGPDGLAAYRAILSVAAQRLTPHGAVLFEVGAGQADDVADMMRKSGLPFTATRTDLGGHQRVVAGAASAQVLGDIVDFPVGRRGETD